LKLGIRKEPTQAKVPKGNEHCTPQKGPKKMMYLANWPEGKKSSQTPERIESWQKKKRAQRGAVALVPPKRVAVRFGGDKETPRENTGGGRRVCDQTPEWGGVPGKKGSRDAGGSASVAKEGQRLQERIRKKFKGGLRTHRNQHCKSEGAQDEGGEIESKNSQRNCDGRRRKRRKRR